MPSLFRRKPTELTEPPPPPAAEEVTEPEPEEPTSLVPRKGYTPSKKELGKATPKRPNPHLRRPDAAPVAGRKALTKEEKQERREARRQRRAEITEGMRRGDPKFLAARDQGPERALARDVVDSRRTVGTWFFGGALVVLIGSSSAVPQAVVIANLLFLMLALALTADSVLLCRRVKRLVRERHPDSTQKLGGLYLYVVMRSITFRRLRIPLPRKNFGDPV